MRFIKLNGTSGGTIVFSLDHVLHIRDDEFQTLITFIQGDLIKFDFPTNELCTRMFDLGIDTEEDYELIEIDETGFDGDEEISIEGFSLNEYRPHKKNLSQYPISTFFRNRLSAPILFSMKCATSALAME
jgi:hypothetical protein